MILVGCNACAKAFDRKVSWLIGVELACAMLRWFKREALGEERGKRSGAEEGELRRSQGSSVNSEVSSCKLESYSDSESELKVALEAEAPA